MTTQKKQPQSIFPDFPRESSLTDNKGNLTPTWSFALNDVFQGLQTNFSNEGVLFPALSATDMSTIQSNYTSLIGSPLPQNKPDISGKTVFNTTLRNPYQFIITYDASNPPKVSTAGWVQFTMILTHAGNPNGAVGGALNWLCFDTVGTAMYICTTAGSSNGTPSPQAVWTGINSASDSFLLL